MEISFDPNVRQWREGGWLGGGGFKGGVHRSFVGHFASVPQLYDCISNHMYMLLWINFVCLI